MEFKFWWIYVFFPQMFEPLQNWNQIQLCLVSWIFNSNFVGNLNSFPKGKLFPLSLSSVLQKLEIFGLQKVMFFIFKVGASYYMKLEPILKLWMLKKLIDIDEAHTLCALLLCIYTRKQATITRQKRRHISFLSEVFRTLTLRYFIFCRRYFGLTLRYFIFCRRYFGL
jgi:hypothetical protein